MKSRNTFFSLLVLLLIFAFCGVAQAADALIEKVIYQEENESSVSVTFQLNGPHLPTSFALKGDKPRVVFDFPETRASRSVPAVIDAGGSMVRKIRMGRHSDKTRVVIDLVPPGEYLFEQKFDETKNILTILVHGADSPVETPDPVEPVSSAISEKEPLSQPAAPEETVAAEVVAEQAAETVDQSENEVAEASVAPLEEPVAEETAEAEDAGGPDPDPLLSEVSFDNTSNNGEMALFKLNGFYPPTVSGQEEGVPRIICDFPGTRLADGVVRDLASHGEYVDRIRVEQLFDPLRVQVILELVPNKNYDLQQVFFKEDNLFVIIVNSYDALNTSQPTPPEN